MSLRYVAARSPHRYADGVRVADTDGLHLGEKLTGAGWIGVVPGEGGDVRIEIGFDEDLKSLTLYFLANALLGLQRAVAELAQGAFGTIAEPGSRDEIGRLTEAFNTMSSRLRDTTVSRDTSSGRWERP
ncbi:MAG: HAMP domain-containing protein [Gammaproteobacteria bacterium]